ncbi:cutinase family protein [Mycobacterium sp. DL592]|uniref:cutinase family protein n=1 Tax=Mycobacterium sp. DL592 TaxID=2675524 RepID=UPI00141F9D57|nr:cutinase family protein [Mycobacterium sp. DL592]
MTISLTLRSAAVTALLAGATLASPAALPSALADGCSDIQVVFARGTSEPPGIGRVGQAFVDSLRRKVGNRSVGVYAVNYPASYDFLAAADGANDASAFIQNVVNTCPNTKLVLGGYSQGAAIIDVITSVPFPAVGFTNPLPPEVPDHVAALAVFGNPTAKVGLPLTSSAVYGPKAIDLCNVGDPVCSDGNDVPAHRDYSSTGMTSQAASFVAGLL